MDSRFFTERPSWCSPPPATDIGLKRILVIRGGAIGDFILTLPALKALRDAKPDAHIEILGYPHIASVADQRFYANAVRSIEYGPLSRFFARSSELPDQLVEYFAEFDLIISYLFDPDLIFQANLERAGAGDIIIGPARLKENSHAARQLAEPITTDLGLSLESTSPTIYPSIEDRAFADNFLKDLTAPVIALHPGSGSETKNWPLPNWIELGHRLLAAPDFKGSLLLVIGEADEARGSILQSAWRNNPRIGLARNIPLPQLAAILAKTTFIGHDSGISHLAAAAGANCVLLFGPTDPQVWAPTNVNVRVLRAPDGDLNKLQIDSVLAAIPIR
jgi:heptosyltransferase-3